MAGRRSVGRPHGLSPSPNNKIIVTIIITTFLINKRRLKTGWEFKGCLEVWQRLFFKNIFFKKIYQNNYFLFF